MPQTVHGISLLKSPLNKNAEFEVKTYAKDHDLVLRVYKIGVVIKMWNSAVRNSSECLRMRNGAEVRALDLAVDGPGLNPAIISIS